MTPGERIELNLLVFFQRPLSTDLLLKAFHSLSIQEGGVIDVVNNQRERSCDSGPRTVTGNNVNQIVSRSILIRRSAEFTCGWINGEPIE